MAKSGLTDESRKSRAIHQRAEFNPCTFSHSPKNVESEAIVLWPADTRQVVDGQPLR